jgi:hypothetical protein
MTYPQVTYLGPAHPEASDGVRMRVLHSRVDNRRVVNLPLPVRDVERGLDVLQHPSAYAASRRGARGLSSGWVDSDIALAA